MTGIPIETLRYYRWKNIGPASWRLGRRVVYDRGDVERWLDEQRVATLSGGQSA
jgi:DNA-binding transcriptional MerR regulator